MSAPTMTSEGYVWTPASGMSQGSLPCRGVVSPPKHIKSEETYDCIVIGAGYAGLTAARDLALSSMSSRLGLWMAQHGSHG